MFEGESSAGAKGFRGVVAAGNLDADLAHGDGGKVSRIGVTGKIDEVEKAAVALPHEAHFDEGVGVGAKLASALQQMVNEIAEDGGVGREAVAIVHAGHVPGEPGNLAFSDPDDSKAGFGSVLHVDVDFFRRAEHRGRDEGESR